jgi:pyruvate-formate lyase
MLNHLGSDIENITIGGVDRNGVDATNQLSFMLIQALKHTQLATSASFRISNQTSDEFIKEIIKLNRETGSPAFFNDETTIQMMMNDGYSLEDARDYCLVGCAEPSDNGKTYGATGGTKVYFPTALDIVLNGKTAFFGNESEINTIKPSQYSTFDEFLQGFYTQLDEMVRNVAKATNLRNEIWAQSYPNPLISCTIDGCIDNARDMTDGGAIYNFGAIGGGGLATLVDSLAAIKKFVFEDKTISMSELIEALNSNYRGNEILRQRLAHGPKFGNDDDYVDFIAKDVVNHFCKIVSEQQLTKGGHYKASLISYGLNIYEGMLEPATPNGRKAGEPLSNSISPSNGAETQGITAMFNSLAKLDHTKVGFGDSLNVRYPRYLLAHEKGIEILKILLQTYFARGGFQVQINTAEAQTLKDAQKHPELFNDLIVRVSGYSAYFTQLGDDIQQDIIERVQF